MALVGVLATICSNRIAARFLFFLLILVPLYAEEPASSVQPDYGEALLRGWVQPEYPAAARQAKLEGRVVVDFVVTVEGRVSEARVSQATNEVFNEAALAAVRSWTFTPALEDGKPAAMGMTVPVEFRLAQLRQKTKPLGPSEALTPHESKRVPANVKTAPDPEYPDELQDRFFPGIVRMEITVATDGKVGNPRVLWASHAAFVETALRALEKTEFEPARQGLLPKPAKMEYPVDFTNFGQGTKRADILAANHIEPIGTPPEVLPEPFMLIEPVYPYEQLLTGKSGTATVEFTLDENGASSDVKVTVATAPEFGAALVAAVESWGFKPAASANAAVAVRLRASYAFEPPRAGTVARLAEVQRPGGAGVGGAAGLDRPLKPLWRGFPVYPSAVRAEGIHGDAKVEFIIDRDGRTRLPHFVSASREEFGWAAATAISQWVFEKPMRKGEPVDVRVSIPVDFTPPKT
jgi:TonB family protein